MKWSGLVIPGLVIVGLGVAESLSAEEPSSGSKKYRPTVILDRSGQSSSGTEIKVESGEDKIVGEPAKEAKVAYRNWKKACQDWRSELKKLNRGNLMVAHCEEPVRKAGPEWNPGTIVFESKGRYKIRLGCP